MPKMNRLRISRRQNSGRLRSKASGGGPVRGPEDVLGSRSGAAGRPLAELPTYREATWASRLPNVGERGRGGSRRQAARLPAGSANALKSLVRSLLRRRPDRRE